MKKWAEIVFVIVAILASPDKALADGLTVGDLRESCMAFRRMNDTGIAQNTDKIKSGLCPGLIIGTVDTVKIFDVVFPEAQHYFCLPSNWTVRQGSLIFLKWTKEHPEDLHQTASMGVILSHQAAFPCP